MMEYSSELKRALDLSRKMLDAAKDNDWQLVDKLEVGRQQALNGMAKFVNPVHTESVISELRRLIDINTELVQLSRAEKQQCSEQYFQNRNNKKACQAYFSI